MSIIHTSPIPGPRTAALAALLGLLTVDGGCSGGVETAAEGTAGATTTSTGEEPPTAPTVGPPTSTGEGGTSSTSTGGATSVAEAGEATGAPDECTARRSEVEAILGDHCAACHSGPNAQIYDYVEDLEQLLASGKIVAGDPGASPLYQKVAADEMPIGDPKLTLAEKQSLSQWIEECTAPVEPAVCPDMDFISPGAMIDRMLNVLGDLEQVAVEDQPYIRFFTLTHLHNAGICGPQLDVYRHALAKLLNGLSRDLDVHPLRPLPAADDPGETIYMIDVRDYGWDSSMGPVPDVWELLVQRNPFAVRHDQQNALQLRKLTGTAVPFQTADWFVSDAATAPLYDEILYEHVFAITADVTTMTRFDLEAALGITVAADVEAQAGGAKLGVVRGGFLSSGVSDQNRVIERHRSPIVAEHSYWLSHDFVANVGTGNIFEHPLDFVAAGGEVIWTLPNGLQAYLLVDGAGKRLDVANIDIVHNKEKDGEPIVNGISCMGCHYQGMRTATDELGPFVALSAGKFTELEKQRVANLYPPAPALADVIDLDVAQFVANLAKTGAPLLQGGVEVTQAVHDAFEDSPIDLRRAAAELGMSVEQFADVVGALPGALGTVKTIKVNRDNMRSEFAAAICTLKLGATEACP